MNETARGRERTERGGGRERNKKRGVKKENERKKSQEIDALNSRM